ncbi:putative protein Mb0912 [Mycobacterium bovis AF2122/97] [Rhizoctonia solani]|uniref:Jacalin-type lectin domain-containing protein n=1 Tax=Rhizoctonia solani TaxID=456999 RepID=A0A0K6FQS0_9AGAM|nr:putative protein Mb0912 [Mycobacterium bovis AF2122/97] [Rhizoctonia solani]
MAQYNYGIINVQEDFNYHATLYKYDNHPFRTATSGGYLVGSGLNTLSKYSWIDFIRGFTFMRVRMDEGVYIDMINLRVDDATTTGPDDQKARRLKIHQIADFIEANSAGNAVIVFGDTGSRYTRRGDNIRMFAAQNGLVDAWVQAIGGDPPIACAEPNVCPEGVPANISCEVGDKVLYRGSPIIDLKSTGFFYDTSRFLSPKENLLTDHNPVRVEFGYLLKDGLRQSDLYGGPHGTWFNDLPSISVDSKLTSITLRGGNRLDGLTLTLASGQTFTHGGSGGKAHSLNLTSGEYIESVKLCWGQKDRHTRIFYSQAITNSGKDIQVGKVTGNCATATAPSGYGVVGSYGQDGDEVDQLGFIYAQL